MKNVILTAIKDEAPYIVEWVAYHRALGFDDVLIITNNCSDGSPEICARLAEAGLCHHIDFDKNDHASDQPPQMLAYQLAVEHPLLQEEACLAILDIDEFLVVNVGDGKLSDLITEIDPFDVLHIRWRVFGSGGLIEMPEGLVTQSYFYCAPTKYNSYEEEPPFSRNASRRWSRTYKTLFKYVPGDRLSVHFPRINRPGVVTRYGGGDDGCKRNFSYIQYYTPEAFKSSYARCQVNHYANKSVEEYVLKLVRGDGAVFNDPRGLEHWATAECNEGVDVSMEPHAEALATEVERISALCDLNPLLEASLVWRDRALQDWIALDESHGALYEELCRLAGTRFLESIGYT